jgi:hypothetical protein
MRAMRTYILRLLVDTEELHTLRGVIRAVADDREQTFSDGQALLTLLRQMSSHTDQAAGEEELESTPFEGRIYHEDKSDA